MQFLSDCLHVKRYDPFTRTITTDKRGGYGGGPLFVSDRSAGGSGARVKHDARLS